MDHTHTRHLLKVSTLANGTELALHLHELQGNLGDGPTVGICAAIHGNESTGAQIVLELVRHFKQQSFRGCLCLLPVANPLAFEANRRHTPVDDQNLNRLFPGSRDGWVSEQLAHVMTEHFLNRVDAVIDLHSGGDRPTVDYVYIKNAESLSRSFGSRVLYQASAGKVGTQFDGASMTVAQARGIPAVTVELGGGLIDQTPYIERGVRGVLNMLRVLNVIDEPPVAPPAQIVVDSITTLRPHHGDFLETSAPELGERIEEGDVLGRIINPYTFEVLEEIHNPVPGGVMILSHLTRNLVQPGDYGYMVGSPV
jgi:predicted deacylase